MFDSSTETPSVVCTIFYILPFKIDQRMTLVNIHSKHTQMKILTSWLGLECRVWSKTTFCSTPKTFGLISSSVWDLHLVVTTSYGNFDCTIKFGTSNLVGQHSLFVCTGFEMDSKYPVENFGSGCHYQTLRGMMEPTITPAYRQANP